MQSGNWICIDRIRNKQGFIVGYTLQNCITHQEVKLDTIDLRSMLYYNEISVINLKLSSDNKILLQKSKFQDTVDENNVKYSNNDDIQKSLEDAVDRFMYNMLNFEHLQDTNKLIKLVKLNTQGDINAFTLGVQTDILKSNNNNVNSENRTEILFRYRKNIEKIHSNHGYRASIIVQMISIKYPDRHIELVEKAPDFKIGAFSFNAITSSINCDTIKTGNKFLHYTAKQCKKLCEKRFSNNQMKSAAIKVKNAATKRGIQCITYGLIIITCVSVLSGCGTASTEEFATPIITEQTQTTKSTTYNCDYKTLDLLKTRITTEIDGEPIEIVGSPFRILVDPLKMKDSNGNIIGEASDKYCLFTNDDHVISVDGKIEVIMTGDFNIVGKSYQLYNIDGEQIGEFNRQILGGYSGEITDMNGHLIAKYSRNPFFNDYTLTIYENNIFSDKAIHLIIASFVSDDKADTASSSHSSHND